jgi:alanyl aminopeptidase
MRELGKGRKLPCTMLTATPRSFTVRKLCNVPLMPNTDAAGYYRFTMPAAEWSRLVGSFKSLNAAEHLALLHALRAAFRADGNIAPTFVAALEEAVNTGAWDVVELATTFLRELRDDLLNPASHAGFEASLARTFDKPFARLQRPSGAETPGRALARAAHAMLAVSVARDPEALAALAPQGNALLEAVARGDNASFDEMTPARLHAAISTGGSDSARKGIAALKATPQAEQRNMIVRALAAAREPQAIASIQSFILSGDLRVREIFNYMREAFASSPSREAAWAWLRADYDRIVEVTGAGSQSRLVSLPASLCTKAHEDEIRSFFEPRVGKIVGAPRKLANTLETVARCHAWRKATAASIEAALLPPKP